MKLCGKRERHRSERVVQDGVTHPWRREAQQLVISIDRRILHTALLLLHARMAVIIADSVRKWIVVLARISFERGWLAVYRVRAIVGRIFASTHGQSEFRLAVKSREGVDGFTYPINVSASKFEAWSMLSKGNSGIESASVDATLASDIGGAAI